MDFTNGKPGQFLQFAILWLHADEWGELISLFNESHSAHKDRKDFLDATVSIWH